MHAWICSRITHSHKNNPHFLMFFYMSDLLNSSIQHLTLNFSLSSSGRGKKLIKLIFFPYKSTDTGGFSSTFGCKSAQRLHADMSFHGLESVKYYLSIPWPWRTHQQHASSFARLAPSPDHINQLTLTDRIQTDQGRRKKNTLSGHQSCTGSILQA